MPPTLMHIKAPLCTGTNAGHENSCFVVIIKSQMKLIESVVRISIPTALSHR